MLCCMPYNYVMFLWPFIYVSVDKNEQTYMHIADYNIMRTDLYTYHVICTSELIEV